MEEKRLSWYHKVSYGLGAAGKYMAYMLSASYVLYYFRDVMGVNSIAMGVLLLMGGVFMALGGPVMGVIVAKTRTRWGRLRLWIVVGTLINAVFLVLMFSAPPSLDGGGLTAFASVTYIIWCITYTMMDIPFGSILPAFTDRGKERENLTVLVRSLMGVGAAVIAVITVVAVTSLGGRFDAKDSDNIEKSFNSSNMEFKYFLVELDEKGNPTDNKMEVPDASVMVTVDGVARVFETNEDKNTEESYLNFSGDNTDYTMRVGSTELDESTKNNAIEFALDSADATKAALVVYLPFDAYQAATFEGDYTTAIDMHSTVEVERQGFMWFSMIVAGVFVFFTLIMCILFREESTVDEEDISIAEICKSFYKNGQAVMMVIMAVLVNTAMFFTSNLLIYFFKYDLGGVDPEKNHMIFTLFSGGIMIISMMVGFLLLRKAFSKYELFLLSVVAEIVGYLIMLILSAFGIGIVYLYFLPALLIMTGFGILSILMMIYIADAVDYGENKIGRRDESVLISMHGFAIKLSLGLSAFAASCCLDAFNIHEDPALNYQSLIDKATHIGEGPVADINTTGLRLVMTVGPVVLFLIIGVIFLFKFIPNYSSAFLADSSSSKTL